MILRLFNGRTNMLEEIFSLKPSIPLYHYTDQYGFLGIIKSKEIWLTHTQYLNDKHEFIYAIDLLKDEIAIDKAKSSDQTDQTILEKMLEGLDGIQSTNVMVCSFSEASDSLSQWRAYANKAGVAIGFPSDHLTSIAKDNGIHLAKCLYQENDQRDLIKKVIQLVFNKYKDGTYDDHFKDDSYIPNQVIPLMLRIAPIIKNPAFSEEKEWRFITIKPCTSDKFHFRPSQSFVIPYYRQNLLSTEQELPLEKVVIGPTAEPELAQLSIRGALIKERNGKNGKIISNESPDEILSRQIVKVESSKIPFRSW